MSDNQDRKPFKPFISPSDRPPELTVTAVVIGIILAVIFGAANAYLGLIIGMTISASIPAAVISMAIIRGVLRRNSILENNIVQTITTAGEAVAAGAIFTLPALFLWKANPGLYKITLIVLTGGFLGVLFMIPLRRLLIVKEHDRLPYPEGTACAQVLVAGEEGGGRAKLVFGGLAVGGVFKLIADGFKMFPSEIETKVAGLRNGVIGMDTLPSLLSVGFIVGPRVGAMMAAGGVLAWLVLIPMIAFFGANGGAVAPGTDPISSLDAWGLWDNYIRYIGAGAVATGGIISLVRTLPMLWSSLASTMQGLQGAKNETRTPELLRTELDLSRKITLPSAVVLLLAAAFLPQLNTGIIGAIGIALFGFLFVTVASRIVGAIGSSSSPVSGMTIATLLIVTSVYRAFGYSGMDGMVTALTVGAIICVALAIAGDISQDLKTGYLVGATPRAQQLAMILGILGSGLVIGWVLLLLNDAYGFGSKELPAPKAVLMKLIVEGIMNANMPWDLVFIGVAISIVIELLGVEALPVAVGIYLPVHTSTPIFLGGLVRYFYLLLQKRNADKPEEERVERGVLLCSGLIAGESLIGILIAGLVSLKVAIPEVKIGGSLLALVVFLLLALWVGWMTARNPRKT
ncbi:OPT family oligopeptide transporter [Tumebacillus flagellatus]|uniref:Peptide transporter n=1 Tax=Tumebacillus flagellatus TaxID=1157490 RepID=A0A074LF06_9BACL|nr:oligopeptide transporter, OPT family [Tumebacillus flagellatus]KEO80826.1 peptide transporter [Tumebacillus flagellatus]